MSDEERRRQEERERFERIRGLDTEVQETPRGRRRNYAGGQPLIDSLDPFSRPSPLARTQSYGDIPTDMYLSEQFGQSLNLEETQPYQTGSRYGQQTSGQNIRQTGIPHFARQQPIPETQLVHRYRDPVTGRISLDRLRQPALRPSQWGIVPPSSREMGSYLANLSKDNISQGILEQNRHKSRRQKDLLLSREFQRVEDQSIRGANPVERFVPLSRPTHLSQRRGFVPQTERDMIATYDSTFNKPQREMDRPVYSPYDSKIAPLGRQQWGPLRRAYSMPDLSDPDLQEDINEPDRMALFADRYLKLPTADRQSFKHFRDQVSTVENPNARARMVLPPTIGHIRDMDKRRLREISESRKQLMNYRIGEVSEDILKRARRKFVRKRAYQQTALPTKKAQDKAIAEWLSQGVQEGIPEEEEEDEVEE